MPTKEKRYAISISMGAGNALRRVQEQLERQIGFVPSMSQVVEYLATKEMKAESRKPDNMTGGQNV